ncbi:putative single-stranded DNA specific exonuclease [Paenibacillus sp. NAIST15-1]|nr:putative single-stranded DNA specific exonuclease [Paenibacillus sp. NAIST15-1]
MKDKIPEGTSLLIIVDSSSNEVQTCKEISERGIDIIIIDHHIISDENPYCILINDKHRDCQYPNKDTSGALLAWKVCQVIDDMLGVNYSNDLIDLAGLGLHGDQMSMIQMENRALVNESLNNIKNNGLKAILKIAKKDIDKLNASDFAFTITPFINAATRLDKIELAFEMLIAETEKEALSLAKKLHSLNSQRKLTQKEAIERIIPTLDLSNQCLVVVDSSLGKNMNGLVASDLANRYQRPVVVLGKAKDNDDEYHGSFRSIGFFKFLDFVENIPEVLFSGGHQAAGGVGIKICDLEKFQKSLNNGLKNETFEQVVYYDLELDVENIDENLIAAVEEFSRLSGNQFKEPKFLIKGLYSLKKEPIGENKDTLRVSGCPESSTWFVNDEDIEGIKPSILAMKFRTSNEFIDDFPEKRAVDIVGSLNLNEWVRYKPRYQVVRTMQIFIEDYKIR